MSIERKKVAYFPPEINAHEKDVCLLPMTLIRDLCRSFSSLTRTTGWPGMLSVLLVLLLAGCARNPAGTGSEQDATVPLSHQENLSGAVETDCSYFYFLWGRHAELNEQYEEALQAYEKALICDREAGYIARKLPLILLRLHREDEAKEKLLEYIGKHPDTVDARLLLARIYIREKQFAKAASQYESVHRLHPRETRSLLLLGELYLIQGQRQKALSTLEQALAIEPDNYAAHLFTARILADEKKYGKAISFYKKALRLNWSTDLELELAEVYLRQKNYNRAEQIYSSILASEPANREAGLALVHVYLLEKKNQQAISLLNRLKTVADNPGEIELTLARVYARNEEYEKAAAILRKILVRENMPQARYMLAVLYVQKKQYEDALLQLRLIPEQSRVFEDSLFVRVKLLRLLGREDEAISLLERILLDEKSVKSSELLALLGHLYLKQGDLRKGEQMFDTALSNDPKNGQLLYAYGLFLDQAGRQSQAMSVMEQVIALEPKHAAALNYVGYTWADKRQHLQKALEYIQRAVEQKPESGYIRDSLGWVYFRLGRYDEAVAELKKALALSDEDAEIWEHLGDVYVAMGKTEEALHAYEQAVKRFGGKGKDAARVRGKMHLLAQEHGAD
jgi:tetratricopeptide (TPR) repeat protein